MKINNLTKSLIAFSLLALMSAGIATAQAAPNKSGKLNNKDSNKISRSISESKEAETARASSTKQAAIKMKQEALKTKRAAIDAALAANDYNAWVLAIKAQNAQSPLLNKINATNFSRYVEAYKLRLQAQAIDKELGIDQPGLKGIGLGIGSKLGENQNQAAK